MPHLPTNIDERVDATKTRFIKPPAAFFFDPWARALAPQCSEALAIAVEPALAQTCFTARLLDISRSRQGPFELSHTVAMAAAERLNTLSARVIGKRLASPKVAPAARLSAQRLKPRQSIMRGGARPRSQRPGRRARIFSAEANRRPIASTSRSAKSERPSLVSAIGRRSPRRCHALTASGATRRTAAISTSV